VSAFRTIDYRLRSPARSLHQGAHAGAHAGDGWVFQDWAPLLAHPSAQRLDIRRSLTDPLQALWVRRYRQPVRTPVWIVADLSASMGYAGSVRKLAFLAELVESLAYSSERMGDRFGFVGCAEQVLSHWYLPAHRGVSSALRLAERLRDWTPAGGHARGLVDSAHRLSSQRALVFLVSDFHMPMGVIRQTFERLRRHETVPVVLWDSVERGLKANGAGPRRFADLEGGGERVLWLREELRLRLRESFEERRRRLCELARAYGMEPLFVEGAFSVEPFNRYFAVRS
jgi:hypothetical protein